MLGPILLILAMVLVFPPLVFAGGLVVSALLGLFLAAGEETAEQSAD